MRLDLSDAAERDLDDILEYSVTQWGIARGFEYVVSIRVQMTGLAQGTKSGIKANDVGAGLGRQVSGSHVIWFRVLGDRLRIVRVLHQSRDAGRWVE